MSKAKTIINHEIEIVNAQIKCKAEELERANDNNQVQRQIQIAHEIQCVVGQLDLLLKLKDKLEG